MDCICLNTSKGIYAPPTDRVKTTDYTSILSRPMRGETCQRALSVSRSVPSIVADVPFEITSLDFFSVGGFGELSACLDYLYAVGQHDPSLYTGAAVGSATTITSRAPCLAFAVKWSVAEEQKTAFDMRIQCDDFSSADVPAQNSDAVPVDRAVSVRLKPGCPGGTVYVFFAYSRVGSVPEGRVKVSRAQGPVTQWGEGDPLVWAAAAGRITVFDVPAGITSFGYKVKLLTAHDPELASLLEMIGYFE